MRSTAKAREYAQGAKGTRRENAQARQSRQEPKLCRQPNNTCAIGNSKLEDLEGREGTEARWDCTRNARGHPPSTLRRRRTGGVSAIGVHPRLQGDDIAASIARDPAQNARGRQRAGVHTVSKSSAQREAGAVGPEQAGELGSGKAEARAEKQKEKVNIRIEINNKPIKTGTLLFRLDI